jgi:hypothetical protein
MPRGRPKRGQFLIKLWWPDGGAITYESCKDMDIDRWREAAAKYLDEARRLVANS